MLDSQLSNLILQFSEDEHAEFLRGFVHHKTSSFRGLSVTAANQTQDAPPNSRCNPCVRKGLVLQVIQTKLNLLHSDGFKVSKAAP